MLLDSISKQVKALTVSNNVLRLTFRAISNFCYHFRYHFRLNKTLIYFVFIVSVSLVRALVIITATSCCWPWSKNIEVLPDWLALLPVIVAVTVTFPGPLLLITVTVTTYSCVPRPRKPVLEMQCRVVHGREWMLRRARALPLTEWASYLHKRLARYPQKPSVNYLQMR